MEKSEKEVRLERALLQGLVDPEIYPLLNILSIKTESIFIQQVFDVNGKVMNDWTVLEEARSGDFTGYVRIDNSITDPEFPDEVESFIYHIDGSFKILGYEDRQFFVRIQTPIIIRR